MWTLHDWYFCTKRLRLQDKLPLGWVLWLPLYIGSDSDCWFIHGVELLRLCDLKSYLRQIHGFQCWSGNSNIIFIGPQSNHSLSSVYLVTTKPCYQMRADGLPRALLANISTLKFGWDSEAEFWSDDWKTFTLVRALNRQSMGLLCLWQCFFFPHRNV